MVAVAQQELDDSEDLVEQTLFLVTFANREYGMKDVLVHGDTGVDRYVSIESTAQEVIFGGLDGLFEEVAGILGESLDIVYPKISDTDNGRLYQYAIDLGIKGARTINSEFSGTAPSYSLMDAIGSVATKAAKSGGVTDEGEEARLYEILRQRFGVVKGPLEEDDQVRFIYLANPQGSLESTQN